MMYDSVLTPDVTRNSSVLHLKEVSPEVEVFKSDWSKKQKQVRNAKNKRAKISRKKNRG